MIKEMKMNDQKTNGKWLMFLLLIVAVVLAWYPTLQERFLKKDQQAALTQDEPGDEPLEPIDQAFTPNPRSRTWEVYVSGGHLDNYDKFKILKVRDEYRLKPNYDLLTKWKKDLSFYIPLTKLRITEKTGQKTILCGPVTLDTTEHKDSINPSPIGHTVMIFPEKHENFLTVRFYENSNADDCETVWDNHDSIMDHHGGVAHVEN
jgi:hypothetical protein